VTFEERLNGPGFDEPESEKEQKALRTDLLVPISRVPETTPVVPTLNLIEQMQRELTGDDSVGLGFARAYALAKIIAGERYEPAFKRYILSDTMYYDFEVDGYEFEMIEATDDSQDINEDWLVCTDDEADELVRNSIEELAGYFNAQFLMEQTGIDTEVFDALMKGASASERVMQIIEATCGYDSFVEAAISADGRGHFLASYDGEEREFNNGRMTFYLYRIN
jgi:hypothetical protein